MIDKRSKGGTQVRAGRRFVSEFFTLMVNEVSTESLNHWKVLTFLVLARFLRSLFQVMQLRGKMP